MADVGVIAGVTLAGTMSIHFNPNSGVYISSSSPGFHLSVSTVWRALSLTSGD